MVYVKAIRRLLSGAALLVALSFTAAAAHAQTAAADTGPAPSASSSASTSAAGQSNVTTIVVTGTRITSSGFTAPTPTTTLSSEDLQKSAEPNIFSTRAFHLDLGARFSLTDSLTPQTNTGIDINPVLYDTIGRIDRAGIRYNF